MNFHLTVCRPTGFLGSSEMQEVADSLSWALASQGHRVTQLENVFHEPPTVNIVFLGGLLGKEWRFKPDTRVIAYNFDSFSYGPTTDLLNILVNQPGAEVWDYCARGVKEWQEKGINAKLVPVGYTPNLTRIPKAEVQDMDVFFAGWMTPRRQKIAEDLKAAGLKVYFDNACFSGARDQIISRSKVCLNVHADGRNRFEVVRVSYLLANSKCVVSETSEDEKDYGWLRGFSYDNDAYVHRSPYEKLVETCRELVFDDTRREAMGIRGLSAIKSQDYVKTIRVALNGDGKPNSLAGDSAFHSVADLDVASHSQQALKGHIPRALSSLGGTICFRSNVGWSGTDSHYEILKRYERGLREGDMKDFMVLLRSLAKGKMLEIGVRDGASTSALLLGLEERGGHLTSVDIEDCSHLWKHPLWEFFQLDSAKLYFNEESLDLAFIDGDHTPLPFTRDLQNCLRWVKTGGLILCHDTKPDPNYVYDPFKGEFPNFELGNVFRNICRELKLRWFEYPGAWGMGVIVR